MKGYFLILHEESFRRGDGIGKKMRAQIKTFREAGLECEPYFFARNREMEQLGFFGKAAYLLPWANFSPCWAWDERLARADFLYFRHPAAVSAPMRRLLRRLKAANPGLRVVMEIPTYPYEGELTGAAAALKPKDRYNRRRLAGLVDALAVVSDGCRRESLWGLPVITILNGCRVEEISPRHPRREDGSIRLAAVARISRWHGYDRLIRGMGEYYRNGGSREIFFHVVGSGRDGALEECRALAAEYGLEERVIFHGFQTGAALDEIYDCCDIGVTTMGMHRKGLAYTSDLKSREYLAKGLPVISGAAVDVLHGSGCLWYEEFPADDRPIDIGRLIAFYERVYPAGCDRAAVAEEIRDFARKRCDMAVTLAPVIRYFRGEPGEEPS